MVNEKLMQEVNYIRSNEPYIWCESFLRKSLSEKLLLYSQAITVQAEAAYTDKDLKFIIDTILQWKQELMQFYFMNSSKESPAVEPYMSPLAILLNEPIMASISQKAGQLAKILNAVHQSNLLPAVIDFLQGIEKLKQKGVDDNGKTQL